MKKWELNSNNTQNWTKTSYMMPPQFEKVVIRGDNIGEVLAYLKGYTFWSITTQKPFEFPSEWSWPVGYIPKMNLHHLYKKETDSEVKNPKELEAESIFCED